MLWQGLVDTQKPPEMISGNMTAGFKHLSCSVTDNLSLLDSKC